MDEQTWTPSIYSIQITPNPVDVGGVVQVRIKALDVLGGVQPEVWQAGEIQSGEV